MNLRPALQTFAETQETVLRTHDETRGEEGWKTMTAQVGASRLCEEVGEVLTAMFGQDDVCDFLVSSLQDHVEECGINIDFEPSDAKKEVADVANFCMFLHDVADRLAAGSQEIVDGQA
jgi:NTP pyrophosphatase (non-canonical NTP hydrolase)